MQMPLVSISILSYNQEKFIAEALLSALEQDYENLEVIVSDDGSTDNTPSIILDIHKKYPTRLVPLLHKENVGISANSNRVLKQCRGKYIALQGGDDVLLPGKIKKQVQFMEDNPHVAVSYHEVEVFDSDSNKTLYYYSDRHPMRRGTVETLLRYMLFCCATSVMLRAANVPPSGCDENIPISSDTLLIFDTLLTDKENQIDHIDGVYARYRRHANNVTNTHHIYGLKESIYYLDTLKKKAPWLNKQIAAAQWERTLTYAVKKMIRKEYKSSCKLLLDSLISCNWLGLNYAVENGLNYLNYRWKSFRNAKK